MKDVTTAELAALDQETAELNVHLDLLIATYSGLLSEGTRLSATADLTVFLPTHYTPLSVQALLATAIGRLVGDGKEGPR